MVALDAAYDRVLARDIAALRSQPPQAMSAMDGYAVRSADASRAGARLKVIGEIAAGRPFEKTVHAGEAVRIFTGGVMPEGADAVVIQEDTIREGSLVTVTETAIPGRHIRPAGIDFRKGDVLLAGGDRLTDRDLSLAAGMNYPELPVRRRPRIALLATGDELVMPGSIPGPGQIVYSNGYALRALARHEGAETIDLGIAADTLEATTEGIRRARDSGADVLITTGGASVGDHDLVKQSLDAEGITMAFWKIAMRPGKPMMHGRLGAIRVIGLPGNPVSSYVCSFLFLVPLIRALSGRNVIHHTRERAVLGRDVGANDLREDYLRARLETRADGVLIASPVDHQDSSLLGNLAAAGSVCEILRLPG
jgi:molybdopterin molybdotransferase